MKKDYTEKYITEIIEDRVLLNAQEEVSAFSLDNLIVGSMKKRNGADFEIDCALDVNEHGILVVFLKDVQADKGLSFYHFGFSDMQGIKVKDKGLLHNIILQFKDGRNYLFEFGKKYTEKLPNQNKNMQSFISTLHDQNLYDMKNPIHKKNVKSNRIMTFSYISTLLIFLITVVFFTGDTFTDSLGLMLIIIILTGIIHFILFLFGSLYLSTKRDRPFIKEFNTIMREYEDTNNNEELLIKLSNMSTIPKKQNSKNTFYLTMSNVLQKNDRPEDAPAYLNKVQTINEHEIEVVKAHRKVIKELAE